MEEALTGALLGEVRTGHIPESHLFVLRAPDLLASCTLVPKGEFMGRFYTDFEGDYEARCTVTDKQVSFEFAIQPPPHAWLPRRQEPVVYALKGARSPSLGKRFLHAALKRGRPAYLGRIQHGMDIGIQTEVQSAYYRGGLSVSAETLRRLETMLRQYHPGFLR